MAGECLGRSRGGLTSKIHLAVDGAGLPMSILLTEGQAGDNPQLVPLLEQISVARSGPGRPRRLPDAVLADKASSHPSTRAVMRAKRIRFTCPERSDQLARRKANGVGWWETTSLRPGRVQAPQPGRAVLQPVQTVPRPGNPLRQTRCLLHQRNHHRQHHPPTQITLTGHGLGRSVTGLVVAERVVDEVTVGFDVALRDGEHEFFTGDRWTFLGNVDAGSGVVELLHGGDAVAYPYPSAEPCEVGGDDLADILMLGDVEHAGEAIASAADVTVRAGACSARHHGRRSTKPVGGVCWWVRGAGSVGTMMMVVLLSMS